LTLFFILPLCFAINIIVLLINKEKMQNLDPQNLLKMGKDDKVLRDVVTIEVIKELVKKYPNDMELGSLVRKIITNQK